MIPIFRRLKGLSYRRIDSATGDQTDDSLEEHDDPDGPQPPKRSRFEETVRDNSSTASSMTTSPPPTRPPSVDNLEDQVFSFSIPSTYPIFVLFNLLIVFKLTI